MPDLLTAVVFAPAVGALLLTSFPSDEHTNLKLGAFLITLAVFVLSLGLWSSFDPSQTTFQSVTNAPWIEPFGIRYHAGVDGLSLFLIILTTFLTPLTLLGSWTAVEKHVREFVISMLILETGMLGAFVALDLFLFYVFWEVMLVPMYFLIGIWGGQKRIYAAIKFFIFTMAGSLLMLLAIIYVAQQPDGGWNFSLETALSRTYANGVDKWLFAAFALAFAVKVPLFPVHTWLPDAHTEAPTAGSVILAGVLLKFGVYGMIRFAFPLFPEAAVAAAPVLGGLAVAGIVYGAVAAWVQPDMKKLVAYSSVSHLGFCVLGLTALTVEGVTGSVYQMLAHGISTGGLFLLVGVLYERRHTRMLADYGGIARKVPVFAFFLVLITLASAGMPALSGFPGEFLVLVGTFNGGAPLGDAYKIALGDGVIVRLHHILAVLAATGVILAAVYLLYMVQKVLFGPLQHRDNEKISDLNVREVLVLAPLALIAVVMGVMPGIFLEKIEPSAQAFVARIHQNGAKAAYAPDPGQRRVASALAPAIGPDTPVRLVPNPQLQIAPFQRLPSFPRQIREGAPVPVPRPELEVLPPGAQLPGAAPRAEENR